MIYLNMLDKMCMCLNIKYRSVILAIVITISTLIFPGLMLLSLGIIVRWSSGRKIGKIVFATALVGFLALFNATKRINGDWIWYVDGYLEMGRISLLEYLQVGGISIRTSEPVFYALSFVLSRLSNGNIFLLSLSVSIAIYLTYIHALERFVKFYTLPRWSIVVCIVFALLVGVTFTQSLHLVRQYIAGSLLFLLFVFLLESRFKAGFVLFIIGVLVHNSFIVPASLIVMCFLLWNLSYIRNNFLFFVLLSCGIGYVIGFEFSNQILSNEAQATSALINDGSVSLVVFLQDLLLFCISLSGVIFFKDRLGFDAKASSIAVLFLALFGGMLVGGRELNLFFLRFYFYIEWFRVLGVITMIWYLTRYMSGKMLVLLIIPLSFIGLGVRISQSPWNYGGGLLEHISNSSIWWLDQINESMQ